MVSIQTPLGFDRARDKALLIGVQYDSPRRDPVGTLSTPHRDVQLLKDFLVSHEGYLAQNITVLTDDSKGEHMRPTKVNIEAAIEAFVVDVQPGDCRVFFFAGHGYQIISRTGTEDDDKDEVILTDGHYGEPLDADKTPIDPYKLGLDHPDRKKLEGIITDNFLREQLVDRLPPGARLVAIFDTCHSGTMLDLDYHWSWQHFRTRSRKSGSGYELMSSRRTISLYSVSRAFAFVRKIKRTARKAKASVPATAPSRGRPSAKWTPDEGPSEQLRSSSPPPMAIPEPSEELSSYGPVAASVLSISSAMDSQQAWGGKHTMLSVLLDILRGSKEGQRPMIRDIMEDLQKKTCEFRINAVKSSLEARGKKQRMKSAIAKIKAYQLHQFGSLSPWAAEHELLL